MKKVTRFHMVLILVTFIIIVANIPVTNTYLSVGIGLVSVVIGAITAKKFLQR